MAGHRPRAAAAILRDAPGPPSASRTPFPTATPAARAAAGSDTPWTVTSIFPTSNTIELDGSPASEGGYGLAAHAAARTIASPSRATADEPVSTPAAIAAANDTPLS